MAARKIMCLVFMVVLVHSLPVDDASRLGYKINTTTTKVTTTKPMTTAITDGPKNVTMESTGTTRDDLTTVPVASTAHTGPTTAHHTTEPTNTTSHPTNMTTPPTNMTTQPSNMTTQATPTTNRNVTTENPGTTKTTRPSTTTPKQPTTTPKKYKFNGASFGGGLVVGIAIAVVIILIVYFLKCRNKGAAYDRM